MNFTTLTRAAIRTALIQQGPQTCSDLVRGMGLNPKRHKGTIHAIMVDMESEGILSATMKGTRRDVWFIHTNQIRKRDRLIAALIGWQFVKFHNGTRNGAQPACILKESTEPEHQWPATCPSVAPLPPGRTTLLTPIKLTISAMISRLSMVTLQSTKTIWSSESTLTGAELHSGETILSLFLYT